jgi:hypothetical protein
MFFSRNPLALLFDLSISLIDDALSINTKPRAPQYGNASTQTDLEVPSYANTSTQTDFDDKEVATEPPKLKKINDHTWMLENANDTRIVMSLPVENARQSANEVSLKGRYELICSYGWRHTETPTIYVPGTPAVFHLHNLSKTNSLQLEPDSGRHWIDQHAGKVPKHQFEPISQALAAMDSTMRFNDVDIFVNRSSLIILLRFLGNRLSQALHLDLDVVKNTLFVGRRVKNAKVESTKGSYGHNFEKHFTSEDPELDEAEGHHWIHRYNFSGLEMVVRVETDAYVPNTQMRLDFCPENLQDTATASGISHDSPKQSTFIAKSTMVS